MSYAFHMSDEAHRLSGEGRHGEALALCDTMIRNWPHAYVGHHRKAHVLDKMGQRHLAIKSADRVVALLPEDAFPYFTRARLLMSLGRFAQAVDHLNMAQSRDDGWFGSMIPLLRAECRLRLDDLEGCEAECAGIPDDFCYPGFRGLRNGSKHQVLDDVSRRRNSVGR